MKPNFTNRALWTGDNLDVMRGMNSGCVDLIYLDPPFNSNRDYAAPIGSEAAGAAFKDTWTLSDVDEAWHGEIAERDPALYRILDAAGHSHGKGMKSYLIMMAVRLLEMRRLLKETGSVYLHCDPTASHYLKTLMDAVFGAGSFRNEIVWRRTNAHNVRTRMYPRVHDTLLFYAKTRNYTFHKTFKGYSPQQLKRYKKAEDGRLYTGQDLTMAGGSAERKIEWRGTSPPANRAWGASIEQLEEWWEQGLILTKKDGTPRLDGRKVFLDEMPGKTADSMWEDISRVGNTSKERVGYPTQKPLALLGRIIQTSSNEGDVVLDPFCGCATALVAAERLGREWVGIDLSPLAARLVKSRLEKEMRLFYDVHHRTDVPRRTDLGALPNYRTHRHTLYGRQEGLCAGCRVMFPFRNMTVDHVVPRAKGGSDHLENLQLLCGACNAKKGTRSHEELVAALEREGLRRPPGASA